MPSKKKQMNLLRTREEKWIVQRGKVVVLIQKLILAPFSGKKEDEKIGTRHFATIDTKDVSTFAPPPKRVGSIPGARPEDRDTMPSTPPRRDTTASPTKASVSSSGRPVPRPPPPLPSRSQTSSVNEATSPPPRQTFVPPPKLSKPPVSTRASPGLPPRRESPTVSGPSQDTAPQDPPAQESAYGQFKKTFGTAANATQVNSLRNSFRNSASNSSTTTTPPPPPKVTLRDARTASGLAQKYRKDPSSLSFADAKAGLNVANKVLPPSTDKSPPNRQDLQTATSLGQKWNKDPKSLGWSDLKAGYAVANKFRPEPTQTPTEPTDATVQSPPPEKYGVSDLKSRFANVSLGGIKPPPKLKPAPASPPVEQRQPSNSSPRKPPPPPPPKPRIANGSTLPPTYNTSTKPSSSLSRQSSISWTPIDIPLNFETGWYSSDPMQQIPYLAANASKAISSSSVTASGSGSARHMTWIYTGTFAIRWTTDLSRTFIRVTWSSDDPRRTVQGRQKHFPPPTPLGPTDLEKCANLYGAEIVRYCQGQMGRQVGNGECWTLAHDALEFVQEVVKPRCMVSSGTIHGQCIFQRESSSTISGDLEDVRPGDIVQYLECKFERRQNGRLVYSSSAGAPDHTS